MAASAATITERQHSSMVAAARLLDSMPRSNVAVATLEATTRSTVLAHRHLARFVSSLNSGANVSKV
jgi:hypothetical protein